MYRIHESRSPTAEIGRHIGRFRGSSLDCMIGNNGWRVPRSPSELYSLLVLNFAPSFFFMSRLFLFSSSDSALWPKTVRTTVSPANSSPGPAMATKKKPNKPVVTMMAFIPLDIVPLSNLHCPESTRSFLFWPPQRALWRQRRTL